MSDSIEHNAALKIQLAFKLNNCIKMPILPLEIIDRIYMYLPFEKVVLPKVRMGSISVNTL
jgi:hypothetical protein